VETVVGNYLISKLNLQKKEKKDQRSRLEKKAANGNK